VFSPYYALSRRMGTADPENHVSLNVALYGRRGQRWAMTERGRPALQRSADRLVIGPSQIGWDGETLRISVREWAVPVPQRVEGEVVIRPDVAPTAPLALDLAGRHHWHPIAPLARASVRFNRPDTRWEGHAYVDSNIGQEPLADGFRDWSWSRTIERQRTRVFYDMVRRDGSAHGMALSFTDGGVRSVPEPPKSPLGVTRWRLPLDVRSDAPGPTKLATWEDGPFYARSLVGLHLDGERTKAVHEYLSLERFERRWVQALLPFRMPRRAR
jgi:carotenoid 1,2-hydratase